MLEIDNRYPEYARPYEPIKGRRRHGRLTGNESTLLAQRRLRRLDMTRRGFLTGAGVLIVLTILMPAPKAELVLPKVEPIVIQIEKPVPEPEPEVITEPEETPVVIPDEEPTPTPEPKPKPKPKPTPDPDEEKKNAPVIELDPYVQGPDPEGYDYPTLFFDMKLNDLKGGTAKGHLYVNTGSGFYEPDLNKEWDVVVTYDGSSASGDVWSDNISCLITPEGGGIKGEAKIVFDIVYPDGKKARIESETRPVHMGTFVKINTDYGSGGYMLDEDTDPETGDPRYIFKVDVLVDKTLVDMGAVEPNPDSLMLDEPWTFYSDFDVEKYTDSSGKQHLIYNYYSSNPFPNGEYWFSADPCYPEDEDGNNVWVPIDFYYVFNVD